MRFAMLLIILLALPAFALDMQFTANPPLPVPNLLVNPGFEQWEGDQPAGWRWATNMPENFDLSRVEEGVKGAALRTRSRSGVMSGYWDQRFTVQPGADYLVTGWYRILGGKALVYVVGGDGRGTRMEERLFAESMGHHFLVPVFLRPEFMAGKQHDRWHPIRLPFHVPGAITTVTLRAGASFLKTDVTYDELAVTLATTTLSVRVVAPAGGLDSLRVVSSRGGTPLLNEGPVPAGAVVERMLPGMPTDAVYTLEAGVGDAIHRRQIPAEAQP